MSQKILCGGLVCWMGAAVLSVTLLGCSADDETLLNDASYSVDGFDGITSNKYRLSAPASVSQQLGNNVLLLVQHGAGFFDTFAALSDAYYARNQVAAHAATTPSGIVAIIPILDCENSGSVEFALQAEVLKDVDYLTPFFRDDNGYADFAEGNGRVAMNHTFHNCNEPKPNLNLADMVENQSMSGNVNLKFNSDPSLGPADNRQDFIAEGNVSLTNFSIQRYVGDAIPDVEPEVVSGDIGVSFSTDDYSTGIYSTQVDLGLTKRYSVAQGYERLTLKMQGTTYLNAARYVEGYQLSVVGSFRHFIENGRYYDVFALEPLTKIQGVNVGLYPESGKLVFTDRSTLLVHTAEVNSTGLAFEITQLNGSLVSGDCTWVQIENGQCNL